MRWFIDWYCAHTERAETVSVIAYYALFLGYLFWYQENEIVHWLSLVALPALGLCALRQSSSAPFTVRDIGPEISLTRARWSQGLIVAAIVGITFCGIQLLGRQGNVRLALLSSWRAWYELPSAVLLMVVTAATTEEVFFRGFLQSRLRASGWPPWFAIPASALAFALYHLPYAYLNPRWPSAGHPQDALVSAFATGFPLGLIFGWLFERSRNLLATILAHALVNTVPAMALVHGWFTAHG